MRARKIAGSVLIVTGAILLILRFFLITGEVEFWTGKAKTETRASGQILVRARERYAERIKQNIQGESFKEEGEQGEQEAALGVAYLLGMKEGLDKETTEILKLVGLMHLVVASGTHLGILTEIVKKLFGRFSRFSGAFFFDCVYCTVWRDDRMDGEHFSGEYRGDSRGVGVVFWD